MSLLPRGATRTPSARGCLRALASIGALVTLVACADEPIAPPRAGRANLPAAAVAAPPGASVTRTVVVPSTMQSSPFNTQRTLLVPPNFSISVYARISGARFMAVTPDGNLLVSRPGAGSVMLVRPNGTGDPLVSTFVSGLRKPHDIVFRTIGGTTYVYITETHQINRYVYTAGALTSGARQVVISGLPDASSPELNGTYGHELTLANKSCGALVQGQGSCKQLWVMAIDMAKLKNGTIDPSFAPFWIPGQNIHAQYVSPQWTKAVVAPPN